MSETIPARFRKTKTDKWAVMAPVEDLERAVAGDGRIEVQKRNGGWSTFTVGSLGRPFDVDGVKMCYGYAPGDESDAAGASSADGAAQTGGRWEPERSGGSGGRSSVQAPPRDDSEPLPEYQGGPEDEWQGF